MTIRIDRDRAEWIGGVIYNMCWVLLDNDGEITLFMGKVSHAPHLIGKPNLHLVRKQPRVRNANPIIACACGCGETFTKYRADGRRRSYRRGHHLRGTHSRDEAVAVAVEP